MVYQVGFNAHCSLQNMSREHLGESLLLTKQSNHRILLNPDNNGFFNSRNRSQAQRLARDTGFTKKLIRCENCRDRLLAPVRNDRDLQFASLEIEHRVGGVSL